MVPLIPHDAGKPCLAAVRSGPAPASTLLPYGCASSMFMWCSCGRRCDCCGRSHLTSAKTGPVAGPHAGWDDLASGRAAFVRDTRISHTWSGHASSIHWYYSRARCGRRDRLLETSADVRFVAGPHACWDDFASGRAVLVSDAWISHSWGGPAAARTHGLLELASMSARHGYLRRSVVVHLQQHALLARGRLGAKASSRA